MKRLHLGTYRVLLLLAMSSLVCSWARRATAQQIECQGKVDKVKAVSAPGVHETTANYNTPLDGLGHFDPTPLLAAEMTVGGAPSCLLAQFSTMVRLTDNHTFFQVRLDGMPMIGHHVGYYGITTPSIVEPEDYGNVEIVPDQNLWRTLSHSFFMAVRSDVHTVEVLFARCCGASALAQTGHPVLVLRHQ